MNQIMDELVRINPDDIDRINDLDRSLNKEDMIVLAESANMIVNTVSSCVDNVSKTYRDITMISAQVEIESQRLNHALDSLMIKAKRDIQIYRDTLPLLDKNFASMQARMDRLMDRAMDLLSEDISDESLARQEAIMKMIEMTNNSINGLVIKLLPNQ